MIKFKSLNEHSIREKLILIIVFASTISISIALFASTFVNIRNAEQSLLNRIQITSQIISRFATDAIKHRDRSFANNVINNIAVNSNIINLCLYDKRDKLISGYNNGNHTCLKKYNLSKTSTINKKQDNIWQVRQLITDQKGASEGFLLIDTEIDLFTKFINSHILTTLLILFFTLIVSMYLAFKLHHVITAPILELLTVTKTISRKRNYKIRATKKSNDEIGKLADEYNNMLNKIMESNQKLSTEKEKAIYANQAKSQFLTNMSHELRTPLHGILSFAELGEKGIDQSKEKTKHCFEQIRTNGNRLLSLLNNLLDLSMLETGSEDFVFEKNDLVAVVFDVKRSAEAMLEQKKIKLKITKPEFQSSVIFDEQKISQVLINLVNNSYKFSEEGDTISISFKETTLNKKEAISVIVSDEGVGIPETELDKVFDKFIQSSKTKSDAGGTGLGLAICKEIIEKHNGIIKAANNNKGGAKITFTLPLLQD